MNLDLIKVCIVGLGHWGPNLVAAVNTHPRAKVVCGVDSSVERRGLLSQRLPDLLLTSSLQEALEESSFDVVFISTPTSTHYDLAKLAICNGKDVLVEKPLCISSVQGLELTQLALKQNLILCVGHIFLYNDAVVEMKRIISSGMLGKLNYLRCTRTNLGPIRSDVNALWDLAPHDISLSNYLFDSRPSQVSCGSHALIGQQLEDISQARLLYPDNRVSIIFVSWLDPQKRREVVAVGDNKMMLFDDMHPEAPLRLYDKGIVKAQTPDFTDSFQSFRTSIREGAVSTPEISTGLPLQNECHHFIDCVLTRTRPRTDGSHGLEVVSILEALDRSSRNLGKLVEVDYQM